MSDVSFLSDIESEKKDNDDSSFDRIFSELFNLHNNKLEFFYNDRYDDKNFYNLNLNENEESVYEDNRLFIGPTSYNTENNKKERITQKIFYTIKDKTNQLNNELNKKQNKKRGRWKKGEFKNNKNKDKKHHSKSNEDNVIHKIKVCFIESTMNFINKRYEAFTAKKGNKNAKFLLRIKSEFTDKIKKEKNLLFLNTKIKDLFSSDLSGKYTNFNKDYNKTVIKELYQKNEANDIIDIMEKTVEELLQNYINGDYEEEGFYIENDLNNEREKMENNEEENVDDYTQYFLETAKNFRKIFRDKIPRRKKGTKQTK